MPIRPAPGGLPLVGHVPAYLRDRLAFFAGCADRSGAVIRCRLCFGGRVIGIRNKSVVEIAGYIEAVL